MRAAVYLRQSLDKDGDLLAVSRQREDCLALCARRGWTAKEYVDDDFSASVRMPGSRKLAKRRPDFDRMVADVRAGKVDAIVAWDADRLYRHPRELEDLIDLADDRGLSLATLGGDFDLSTPTGRGNARMKGVFARMEMEQKSVRHKRANRQMAENDGRPWWPSRPFGYDADPDPVTGRWTSRGTIWKHPAEAKLVKEAYRQFNAGATVRSVAAGWNAKGVTTPRGNRWTGTGVRQLLLAARNAGLREYNGTVVAKGTWPAIVTERVWRQAVARLSDPSRTMAAARGRKYLLSGIARCGRCGHGLGSAISSRGQRQYACNGCQRLSRDGAKLDDMIIAAVVERLSRDDAVDLLLPAADEVDTTALREERRALEDGLARLGKDFAKAPAAFRQSALDDINEKLAAIDAQLQDPGKAAIFEDVIGADDVEAAFLGLDLGRRRTIVDALMTITVHPVGKGTGAVFDPDAIDVDPK